MKRTISVSLAALMLAAAPAAAQDYVVIERDDLRQLLRAQRALAAMQAEERGGMDEGMRGRRDGGRAGMPEGMRGEGERSATGYDGAFRQGQRPEDLGGGQAGGDAMGFGGRDDAYTGPYNFPEVQAGAASDRAAAPRDGSAERRRQAQVREDRRFRDLLETFDRDDDGRITQEEVDRFRSERLAEFDENDDGELGMQEYRALWMDAMRERMVRRFQNYDRDGSGAIEQDEFQRQTQDFVAMRDRDGSGAIDSDDFQLSERQREGRAPGFRDDGGQTGQQGGQQTSERQTTRTSKQQGETAMQDDGGQDGGQQDDAQN